ncbi:SDR family NAD(P)-dependent oxidoreductase [Nonomuraea sp. NPDC003709]|uniref:SDR family NAD(P)-dependent oxidoreductase n=1 Tax=Nonomuraea sp. NPDC003709 TaxID=3154450 RepID=UPI0033ADB94E
MRSIRFLGVHRVVRAILPAMRRQGRGRLILMSSSAAVSAIPFHSLYSASKAALNHYADALRDEVAPFGIEVACMEATSVRTGAADSMITDEPIHAYEPRRTRVVDRFRQLQHDGRSPEPLAQAIVRAVESRKMRHVYRVGPRAPVPAGPAFRAARTCVPPGLRWLLRFDADSLKPSRSQVRGPAMRQPSGYRQRPPCATRIPVRPPPWRPGAHRA